MNQTAGITLTEYVTIHTADPFGAGFGIVESTGEEAYIPATVMFTARLSAGSSIQCRLLPNKRIAAKTPWFVGFADPDTRREAFSMEGGFLSRLQSFLDEGDAWTPEAAAEALGVSFGLVSAGLEQLYRDERAHKFVMFHKSSRNGLKVWYTRCPDRCDVGEFDE